MANLILLLTFIVIFTGCSPEITTGGKSANTGGSSSSVGSADYDFDYDFSSTSVFGDIGTAITGEIHAPEIITGSRHALIAFEVNGTTTIVRGSFPGGKDVCRFRIKNVPPLMSRVRAVVSGNGVDIPNYNGDLGDYAGYWEGQGTAFWSLFNDGSGHYYYLDYRGGDPNPYLIFHVDLISLPFPG